METCADALARLCDPNTEVSAHYLISGTGQIWRMVEEYQRAWHAGSGRWGDVTDVNSHSIGIELSNTGLTPFAEPLMTALEAMLTGIMARWRIPPERVIAHSDMAPSRKQDPGPRFDWRRLALGDLSVWPEAGQGCDATFMDHATAFGYSAEEDPEDVLKAFRWRFRPWHDGPPDRTDTALAADLARRFPIDRTAATA